MQVSVPKTINDYKLRHAVRLMNLANQEEGSKLTFANKCQHVASYSDLDMEQVKKLPKKAVNTIFEDCINTLSTYKKNEPLSKVKLPSGEYQLVDIFEQTAGWLIDFEVEQEMFFKQPEKMVALCYVEKGKKYGDVKKSEREKIFLDEFPAYLFFDLNAFFLRTFDNYTTVSALLQERRTRKMLKKAKRKAKMLGILPKRLQKLFIG